MVQRSAAATGLAASAFGGHSLRAGLATAAAKAGKSERTIMAQTGHRSVVMVRSTSGTRTCSPTTRPRGSCKPAARGASD